MTAVRTLRSGQSSPSVDRPTVIPIGTAHPEGEPAGAFVVLLWALASLVGGILGVAAIGALFGVGVDLVRAGLTFVVVVTALTVVLVGSGLALLHHEGR